MIKSKIRMGLLLCEDACRDFVNKVETGRARSVKSYKKMKDALAILDEARDNKNGL